MRLQNILSTTFFISFIKLQKRNYCCRTTNISEGANTNQQGMLHHSNTVTKVSNKSRPQVFGQSHIEYIQFQL